MMWILETFVYPLFSFLTNFFTEIMVPQMLFCTVFKRRKYWWLSMLLWCVTNVVFVLIPNFYNMSGPFTVGGWLNFSFAIAFLVSSAFFFCTVKITVKDAVFYSVAAYAIQNFVHNITFCLNHLLSFSFREDYWFVVAFCVMLVAYIAFYLIIVRRVKRGENTAIENKYLVAISVITIIVTYVLSLYFLPVTSSNDVARLYAAFCCMFLLFMQFSVFDKGRMQREKETVEHLLYAEQKQYDLWKANIDIINVKCHDLKHQISRMRKMGDNREQEESLKEIEKAVLIYDSIAKTGNETLDIILTEKCLYCENNGIQFSYLADVEKLDFLQNADLCSLFGNALDNAIESVRQVENPEKRIMSMNIYGKGNMLNIHIDNYHNGTVRLINGLPVTTKADKRFHGFGIKSIQMIVEKYGGKMQITATDEIFNLDIMFLIHD